MISIYSALLLCGLTAGFTAFVAKQKNRSPITWFFLGLVIGIVALLLVALLPPSKKVTEEQKVVTGSFSEAKSEAAMPSDNHHSFDRATKRIPTSPDIQWFYINEELETIGPIKLEDLRKSFHDKKLDEMSYIWCDEFDDWIQIQALQNHNVLTDPDLLD